MPTARPMLRMMLRAKTESENAVPSTAVAAAAMATAAAARASGMRAATRAPKTTTRITRAAGTPMSSPRLRSLAASWLPSKPQAATPVITTW